MEYANYASVLDDDVPHPNSSRRTASKAGHGSLLHKVTKEMWVCERCDQHSFLSRQRCFHCNYPRPQKIQVVAELWRQEALGKGEFWDQREEPIGKGSHEEEGKGCAKGKGKGSNKGDGAFGEVGGSKGPRGQSSGPKGAKRSAKGKGAWRGGKEGWQEEQEDPRLHTTQWVGLEAGASWADASEHIDDAQEEEDGWRQKATRKGRGRWGVAKNGGKGKTGNETGNAEGPAAAQGGKEEQSMPEGLRGMHEPFVPLPLPRKLLASRLGALEARVSSIKESKPDDPRVAKGAELLEETRRQVRDAGGRSVSRMVFGLADGEKEIHHLGLKVEEGKARVQEASAALEDATLMLEAAKAKLANARSRQAHRGFQVAAEMGRHTGGYELLEQSLWQINLALLEGNEAYRAAAAPAFRHVEEFIQIFAQAEYVEEQDPYLRGLDSDSARSDAGSPNSEATKVYDGTEELHMAGSGRRS